MFNYKRFKKAAAEVDTEKQLDKVRDENDGQEVAEKQLKKSRENKDRTKTLENQLSKVRTSSETVTLEAQLDGQKVDDTPVRNGLDKHQALPVNLLAETNDQKKVKALEKAAEDPETAFWDKYVDSQMVGEHTKVPNKTGPSQLQNNPDRFSGLKADDVMKNKNVKEMVMASLRDADAMLYHIYRAAAEHGRDLTADEQKLVEGINRDKVAMTQLLLK